MDEIAQLLAVAVNLNRSSFECEPDEPPDEALAIVSNQLTGTVDVGQPQRTRADAEHVVVDEMIVLAGRLVDAVDVGGTHQV